MMSYTQIEDIEKELGHYKQYFKDKIVYYNCDDPKESNFWKYFALNFEHKAMQLLIQDMCMLSSLQTKR